MSAQQWCVKLQVPAMAFQAVMDSSIDSRKKITQNVLLAGANTLFDGLPEMLFKQLKVEGKARVRPPPSCPRCKRAACEVCRSNRSVRASHPSAAVEIGDKTAHRGAQAGSLKVASSAVRAKSAWLGGSIVSAWCFGFFVVESSWVLLPAPRAVPYTIL
eukprot:COSAG01_NODE_286_length_19421_cov_123.895663_6_plen_159_part_00